MSATHGKMLSYRGIKPKGFSLPQLISRKNTVLVLLLILCFFFIWAATSRLEDVEMSKVDTNFRKSALRPAIIPTFNANSTHDLMIFSYMRSGSTMTGEVFVENSDFFYVFEPLLSIVPYQYLTTTDICKMRDMECRSEEFDKKYADAMSVLTNIYSCKLRQIPPNTLEYIVKEGKSGAAWTTFADCTVAALQGQNITVQMGMTKNLLNHCFDNLESSCQSSKSRVTKVLRLSVRVIPKLLSEIPSLKILLLVRDPRGIINSRLTTDWFPICEKDTFTVFENIRSLCKKMEGDKDMLYRLKNLFPGRLLIHRLEDVVADSPALFREIFDFMNLRNMDAEMERIKAKYVNQNYEGFIGKWKSMLQDKFRTAVDEHCQKVLHYYEYVK